jgi:drug/metabolite transporter (DMT)-like permease
MQAIATAIGGSLVLVSGSRLPIPDAVDRSSVLVLSICFCVAAANWLFQALVKRSGSIFASQSSYLVTIAGIGWSVLLLDEALPPSFWVGVAAVLLGIFIVQPGRTAAGDLALPTRFKALM